MTPIEIISEYQKMYSMYGETYTADAYMAAVLSLKGLSKKPLTEKMASIVANPLKAEAELKKHKNTPKYKAFRELSGIIGVGAKTIMAWMAISVYNIGDLCEKIDSGEITLTKAQSLGLMYYDDLAKRIPREDITNFANWFKQKILKLGGNYIDILGSYRRGHKTSGDIDVLISGMALEDLTRDLQGDQRCCGIIAGGDQKLSLLWRLESVSGGPSIVRQLDIFMCTEEQKIPYLLYGTGSAEHNEYIRGLCKRSGYRLNQMGLYKKTEGGLKLIVLKTEREIYDILSIPYVPPSGRG